MSAGNYTKLPSGTSQWVQHKVYELEDIPDPSETWTSRELGLDHGTISKLRHDGLIRLVERQRSFRKANIYQTKPELYQAIQVYLEKADEADSLLPCDHSGFINRGDSLECKRCGEVHDKREVV